MSPMLVSELKVYYHPNTHNFILLVPGDVRILLYCRDVQWGMIQKYIAIRVSHNKSPIVGFVADTDALNTGDCRIAN